MVHRSIGRKSLCQGHLGWVRKWKKIVQRGWRKIFEHDKEVVRKAGEERKESKVDIWKTLKAIGICS